MADLTATLLACQSPDLATRTQAEKSLGDAEKSNYAEFALALANELGTEGRDPASRQLAGIHFKNLLYAKDEAIQQTKLQQWKSLDSSIRGNIKAQLLRSLSSSVQVARHTAGQACSEVAAVELPHKEWPEFLPSLMKIVQDESQPDGLKISTLECIGFTCERLGSMENEDAPDIPTSDTDQMLNAIVGGIGETRPDPIRLSALKALRNSLFFTRKNMENSTERDFLMRTICQSTQCQDVEVRVASYECFVQIAYQYYDKLRDYMKVLFDLTFTAIKTDDEKVAFQAIEFWSTLCEEEMDIVDEIEQCQEVGEMPSRECVGYVAGALKHLVPLLTETLTKQDEDDEEDEWSLSMAAASCLSLIATTVRDDVVQVTLPFISLNIQSENWRLREAATMAFCSILEGPSSQVIGPCVNHSIPVLLKALSDSHVMVKDTTAWTIGRICELHVRAIPDNTFPTLVNGLMEKLLTESPRVSSQACFALHNLAAAFDDDESAKANGTNALTPYMKVLLERLMQVSQRTDATEHNLRPAAFEAITVLIQNSAPDCNPLLLQLLPVVLGQLKGLSGKSFLTNEEKEMIEGTQGLLCGVIQVIVQKLPKQDMQASADDIVANVIGVLEVKNATCHEEAFSALSAVCDQLENDFEKYISTLAPFIIMGLKNFEAFHVCTIAVGLVGDIARCIEVRIQPYCDQIMTALVESLQNEYLHRSVKPPVLSCLGDLAMAIGSQFEHYLSFSMMMLMQASETGAPEDDQDLIEYVGQLREGILEAYTGIIQGFKDDNRVDLIQGYIGPIAAFIEKVSAEHPDNAEMLGKAVGLIGDIASISSTPGVKEILIKPFVHTLLSKAYETGDDNIMETCNWARGEITQALS